MSNEERFALISTGDVEKLMLNIRGMNVLLDRDVAMLYGVETRIVNQAVRNNPAKFPGDYIIELTPEESSVLRSKILTLEQKGGKVKPINMYRCYQFIKVSSHPNRERYRFSREVLVSLCVLEKLNHAKNFR